MKFSEIAGRITGFSTPIFGVSWTPPQLDVEAAREVIVFLEDRRVLYSPYEVEIPDHVLASVFEIRRFLTDRLRRGGVARELSDSLRAMRTACRKFIETISERRGGELYVPSTREMFDQGTASWIFNQSLGELRATFGLHVAQLAVRYGLDVDGALASILPLNADQDSDPATEA